MTSNLRSLARSRLAAAVTAELDNWRANPPSALYEADSAELDAYGETLEREVRRAIVFLAGGGSDAD